VNSARDKTRNPAAYYGSQGRNQAERKVLVNYRPVQVKKSLPSFSRENLDSSNIRKHGDGRAL